MALDLPDFPWDELDGAKRLASSHQAGLIDLSVGSPVDPTPNVVQKVLADSADAHSYPTVFGSEAVRAEIATWWAEVRGATAVDSQSVMPTIGSKEMVGLLPLLLGLGTGDTVVIPEIAYPTYEVGASLVGATVIRADDPADWPEGAALVWVNSPSNPTGVVRDVPSLRAAVARAREIGAVLASDECYGELGSPTEPSAPSLLSDQVTGGDLTGLLALYSLSKQSHMAGYRAAMIAGDKALIQQLLLPRRHLGLISPEPIQQALAAGLRDRGHTAQIRQMYQQRRAVLHEALTEAGWSVDGGVAGLYLWVTKGMSSTESVDWFATRGILVAPGHFYGQAGARHVRVALTASDRHIAEAAERIRQ